MHERKITIGEGGRFVIPAAYRKAMHVETGDEMVIRLQNGELRIFCQEQALKNLRKAVKKSKKGKSTTDEFLNFRKKDSM